MAQNILTDQAGDDETPEGAVSENGSERSNVMPISPKAAREIELREGRARADEIFRTSMCEGEALRTGQVLRRVREALGYELSDVKTEICIGENFLMSIERMEVQSIAAGYLKVYLLAYARFLGLPEQEVVQRYTRECGGLEEVRSAAPVPKIGTLEKARPNWLVAGLGVAIVAGLIGAALTGVIMGRQEAVPVSVQAPVAVSGARDSLFSDQPEPVHLPADVSLQLVAVRQGWLEVRGSDGTIFLSRTLAEGESYFPRMKAGWTVSARNGGAFEWRVGDLAVGRLGPEGAQVFSVSVDDQLPLAAERIAAAAGTEAGSQP